MYLSQSKAQSQSMIDLTAILDKGAADELSIMSLAACIYGGGCEFGEA